MKSSSFPVKVSYESFVHIFIGIIFLSSFGHGVFDTQVSSGFLLHSTMTPAQVAQGLMHCIGHSFGGKKNLNRKKINKKGLKEYRESIYL